MSEAQINEPRRRLEELAKQLSHAMRDDASPSGDCDRDSVWRVIFGLRDLLARLGGSGVDAKPGHIPNFQLTFAQSMLAATGPHAFVEAVRYVAVQLNGLAVSGIGAAPESCKVLADALHAQLNATVDAGPRTCPPSCDHKWNKACALSCYDANEEQLLTATKPAAKLTVGAALAAAQSGTVIEYRHLDRWWQILVDSKSVLNRLRKIDKWGDWKILQVEFGIGLGILPLPCTIVPFDLADLDPAQRFVDVFERTTQQQVFKPQDTSNTTRERVEQIRAFVAMTDEEDRGYEDELLAFIDQAASQVDAHEIRRLTDSLWRALRGSNITDAVINVARAFEAAIPAGAARYCAVCGTHANAQAYELPWCGFAACIGALRQLRDKTSAPPASTAANPIGYEVRVADYAGRMCAHRAFVGALAKSDAATFAEKWRNITGVEDVWINPLFYKPEEQR